MRTFSFAELCPPEIEDKFIGILKRGNHRTVAARMCGLNPSTVSSWINRGDGRDRESAGNGDLVRFAKRVLEAEAEAEDTLVGNVLDAAEKDGNVAIKFLSRRYPDRWGEKTEATVKVVSWLDKALDMLKSGEVTLDVLETTLGPQLMLDVRKRLSPGDAVEGEYKEVND
jgi:hypothetical protein